MPAASELLGAPHTLRARSPVAGPEGLELATVCAMQNTLAINHAAPRAADILRLITRPLRTIAVAVCMRPRRKTAVPGQTRAMEQPLEKQGSLTPKLPTRG